MTTPPTTGTAEAPPPKKERKQRGATKAQLAHREKLFAPASPSIHDDAARVAKPSMPDDIRDLLDRCASELRLAAWSGLTRASRAAMSDSEFESPPDWSRQATVAFDVMDATGTDPARFSSCKVLRPWVGEVAP